MIAAANPAAPAVIETHVSTVFLVGDRAYKLKKAIDTGFLDFRRREARQRACEEEVALNRRLAPDVYLGVAEVRDPGGVPCEHLVVMRRMPAARRLSTLAGDGGDVSSCVRAVARAIASFHERAERGPDIAGHATAEAVRTLWDVGFSQLRPYVGSLLDPQIVLRVQALAGRYLNGRAILFEQRIEDGRAVDGHGDLLADDIYCLDDGVRILDCVEFDPRLRHGDALLDVAMLAMDLERLGRRDLARTFLDAYAEFTGRTHPASLAHHYIAYRAFVRCKIACLRHDQGDPAAADEARALLDIARSHLEQGQIGLLLVGGAPGAGKTTLAASLADALGWTVLRSDEIRRLHGSGDGDGHPEGFERGPYAPEQVGRTYIEMLHHAEHLLRLGESVILDATWRHARERREATLIATRAGAQLMEVCCEAPTAVRNARIVERARHQSDSDAGVDVADRITQAFEPWPGALPLDTTATVGDQVDTVSAAIVRS